VSTADSWAFLEEPRIGVLSLARAGRAPHASPIWYWVDDGGLLFTIPHTSAKARLLREPVPADLTVHADAWPYRYVSVEGVLTAVRDRTTDELRLVARRYLGTMLGDAYVDSVKHGGLLARLDVEKITDVDFR
jgi:nitroimidazol reductase NimA-like FMN-containing flavoprotein (pyridoxamine 5'-phosphate oxidase superfamily)